jgi:hypothetical protein
LELDSRDQLIAATMVARHTASMRQPGSDQQGVRSYGALGCLVIVLFPTSLLSEWIGGDLTWGRALALTIGAAFFLAVPLLRAGRRWDFRPDTRLSKEEAMRIAREAAASSPLVTKLVLRGVWVKDGRLAWHFWTPTRGSALSVVVEDASGEAQVQERLGR